MMKLGAVILLSALSPFDIDPGMFDGVWIGADNERPESNHVYFKIDELNAGRFVYVVNGKSIVDFEFSAENVTEPQGYLELTKSFENWGVKIMLSGWVSGEDRGMGMLTGIFYMYQLLDDKPMIFNSHFLWLWAIAGPIPEDDSDRGALLEIHKRYSDTETES